MSTIVTQLSELASSEAGLVIGSTVAAGVYAGGRKLLLQAAAVVAACVALYFTSAMLVKWYKADKKQEVAKVAASPAEKPAAEKPAEKPAAVKKAAVQQPAAVSTAFSLRF
jgi:mannitol-specific phosphotransferase system IIBC component